MKLIKSLMGRRQFLMGAAATSPPGLAGRKMASAFPAVTPAVATPLIPGAIDATRYRHFMSPLFPQIKELDLNPLKGTEKDLYAIDARIILDD